MHILLRFSTSSLLPELNNVGLRALRVPSALPAVEAGGNLTQTGRSSSVVHWPVKPEVISFLQHHYFTYKLNCNSNINHCLIIRHKSNYQNKLNSEN